MRVSLWPGLLRAAQENQRRQQERVRLFEHGTRFEMQGGVTHEIDTLAGIACGARLPEQWGVPKDLRTAADFFDVKGDLEALFAATGDAQSFVFEAAALPASAPGTQRARAAARKNRRLAGRAAPGAGAELDFTYAPVLFELDFDALAVQRAAYQEISRFPQVRRDLAVVVDESVTLSALASV